ncbi:DegT/DnrJ/EryC1/StrS family aminotransferase [Solimonas terrae]|uniref:GDP-perosamine synthase n=1 Tax=Solimonas terrae TaxID=1396819 RepID=A0A6M2BXF4_9GAMM|nr:aminotransferase class I/II-fold pyridoxal phosphate-dependent enzyme [Solimonas terrae]NGY06965.1 aminotransferase class I/II-fold pyridoxal phosphate-dependent enzyme [Solimonas terrae]
MQYRIPVYQPDLSGNEKAYVAECLDSTWISSKGRFIEIFERNFANYVDAPYAATVCNGTVALHLALLALGIGPGDEVIVPTLTYVASVNAIRYVGAVPVFVDSLADTWQVDPDDVERKIGPRTRAVMAVHLYGGACEMERLAATCARHRLLLVEDCAEAIGTRLFGRHVGTFGDVATFSFFGNKTITTGEGGMIVCRNAELDARLRHLRGQGLVAHREYWHDEVGYNYRMTNICAALGVAQLERVDAILNGKIELATRYRTRLSGTPLTFQGVRSGEESSYWMVTALTPSERQRDQLRSALSAGGVETRPIFHPVHTMPMYREDSEQYPVAVNIASRGLNFPSWQSLSEDGFEIIIDLILAHFGETA